MEQKIFEFIGLVNYRYGWVGNRVGNEGNPACSHSS